MISNPNPEDSEEGGAGASTSMGGENEAPWPSYFLFTFIFSRESHYL